MSCWVGFRKSSLLELYIPCISERGVDLVIGPRLGSDIGQWENRFGHYWYSSAPLL